MAKKFKNCIIVHSIQDLFCKESRMSKLYGLIFDVDGVIADTEAINARATIKAFEHLFSIKGVKREDFEAGLGRGAEEYVKAGARIHGLELTEGQVKKATQLRQEYFLKILATPALSQALFYPYMVLTSLILSFFFMI